jgi:hypothetical protein
MNRYVEGDAKVRNVFLACVLTVIAAGFALRYYVSSLPMPVGTPEYVGETLMSRNLLGVVLLTLFYLAYAAIVVWFTAKTVRSKQFPPAGMRMPFRTKIYSISNPTVLWAVVVLLLCAKAYIVILNWQIHWKLQSLVDLVTR